MLVYKYPGNDIEYLNGKKYNIKVIDPKKLLNTLANGWSASPEAAEALHTSGINIAKGDKPLKTTVITDILPSSDTNVKQPDDSVSPVTVLNTLIETAQAQIDALNAPVGP